MTKDTQNHEAAHLPITIELIWEEYKYRHEHVWNTIFRLTGASVLMSIVPYLDKLELVKEGHYWVLAPPVLAVFLVGFGILRMWKELKLLNQVREEYRKQQRRKPLYFEFSSTKNSLNSFRAHVCIYLVILLLTGVVNLAVLFFIVL